MNPVLMAAIVLGLVGLFSVSAVKRLRLLRVGDATWETRTDRLAERLGRVWDLALAQRKMRYYLLAGLAHQLIFLGFGVLLLRSLVLWGRGFEPSFNLWVLGPEPFLGLPLGAAYGFLKDVFALLVLLGVVVFFYLRLVKREKRMTLSGEALLILGIITTMMLADLTYDGASQVLASRFATECAGGASDGLCATMAMLVAPLAQAQHTPEFSLAEPGGSLMAVLLSGVDSSLLTVLARAGFWTHSTLVLVFLNILPYSKHFHIITAIPNVFLMDLTPRGRLRPLAPTTEALMAAVEKATEGDDLLAARVGYSRIQHFTWKDNLDFYTCTECGRCSDNCPAFITGKLLSPKQFTLDLRNNLYGREKELTSSTGPGTDAAKAGDGAAKAEEGAAQAEASAAAAEKPAVDLVPSVIHPDVLWACTTCRACEEQCPVAITYVDKIVQMRRNLVVIKGEFPQELAKPFEGMETNGNPWNLSRLDRVAWAQGLDLVTFAEKPTTPVLFWVGCAASYDDRAKKIARTTAGLLKMAGVDFAVLAEEESCTGDPARRAGNEYLFSMLAEANAATLNGYKEQGGIRQIVTTCPHCFNTLANEYPDFGAKFEIVHHSEFLLGLLAEKKLVPKKPVRGRVAYHDSCYLGRYNDIYDPPREILKRIEGVELVEVEYWNRNKGLCCGAGGAQMWMEEQNKDRVNVKRTLQLIDTGAQTLATACPFCMTMVRDGIKSQSREEELKNLDVVELLALSCGFEDQSAPRAPDDAAA
ncbi:MAG TPA: (Fe-S)-binding protein [Polyangiaceae bacterium]|nr:(Fe-S)-binding protein [Polyangiaceae bacterium]